MGRDTALHPFVISNGMISAAEANQDVDEINRPSDEQRRHEPMAELDDVIDLKPVLRSVGWLTQKLVDQREPIHTCPNLPEPVPGVAPKASDYDDRYAN